jgi:hypothetical protein
MLLKSLLMKPRSFSWPKSFAFPIHVSEGLKRRGLEEGGGCTDVGTIEVGYEN